MHKERKSITVGNLMSLPTTPESVIITEKIPVMTKIKNPQSAPEKRAELLSAVNLLADNIPPIAEEI
jgi:hypothetical protein